MKSNNFSYNTLSSAFLPKVINDIGVKTKYYNGQKPLRIIIFGYFGMKNIGDDAILITEIRQLQQLDIPVKITVPSRYPLEIESKFNVDSFRFGNIMKLVRTLLKTDLVIIGGGGLFCNVGENISMRIKIADFLFTVYKTLFFIIIPKLLSKKVIVFGVGYYRNQGKLIIKLTSKALKFVDYISVRDSHSYIFLEELLPNKHIHFFKDVVFSLQTNIDAKGLFYDLSNRDRLLKVGISLTNIKDEKTLQKILKMMVRVMDKYSDKCYFYYFPFNANSNMPNDLDLGKSLAWKLVNKKNYTIIDNNLGPELFFSLFGKLDAAICMRFHSQIFAYIQKIPFIGISYDKKCTSFLTDIQANFMDIKCIKEQKLEKFILDQLK